MTESKMLTSAAALGGLAFVMALIGLPVLFSEIASLDDQLAEHARQYRMESEGLWRDIQVAAKPVRHLIKRQAPDFQLRPPVSTDGIRILECANGNPLRNPDIAKSLIVCRDSIGFNGGCPTGFECHKGGNTARTTGICCPNGQRDGTPRHSSFGAPTLAKTTKAPAADRNVRQLAGGSCNCNSENTCPAGPKGAPGPPGMDGMDGGDGKDGRDGQAVDDFTSCGNSPCQPCPNGPPGPDGPKGAAGSPGSAGPSGAPGTPGSGSSSSSPGPKGDSGSPGADGSPGAPGSDGSPGVGGGTGSPGPKGPSGSPGPAGPKGPEGSSGDGASSPGDAGPAGPEGDRGARGSDGSQGGAGGAGGDGNDAQYCPCPARNVDASVLSQQYARRRAFAFQGV